MNRVVKFGLLLVFILATNNVYSFSSRSGTCDISGVPTSAMPGRTVSAGASSSFAIAVSPPQFVPGTEHTIILTRTSGAGGFRGVLLYVEDASSPSKQRIGALAAKGDAVVQGLSCPDNVEDTSTLTHGAASSFASIQEFTWQAPANITGPIIISAIAYEAGTTWNVPTPLAVTAAPAGPIVVNVNTNEDTGDGELADAEQTSVEITQIIVTLDRDVMDGEGDSAANDVTNPANYLLFTHGQNGVVDTQSCDAGLVADDMPVTIDSVTYGAASRTARLALSGGTPLQAGKYRLMVCGTTSIEDLMGNPLDGNADGVAGDDYIIDFTVVDATDECNFIVIPSDQNGGAVVCI